MKQASKILGTALALAIGASTLAAAADNVLVKFDGGIGSTPVRAGAIASNAPLANDVFTITPGGRPWVIRRLEAQVKLNGDIPPGMAPEVVRALRDGLTKTFKDPEFLTEVKKRQYDLEPLSGEEMQNLAREVVHQPADVVERVKKLLEN